MSVRIQLQSRNALAPHISFKQSDKPIDESQFFSGIKIKPTGSRKSNLKANTQL